MTKEGTPLPAFPWLASQQYSMRFILSNTNEIVLRADHLPYETLKVMAKAATDLHMPQPTPPTPAGAGTETPRTDAAVTTHAFGESGRHKYVDPDFARQLERELNFLRRQAEADRATIAALNIQNTEWAHKITGLRGQCDLLQKEVSELHDKLNEAWSRSSAFAAQFRQKDKTLVCDPASAASVIIALRAQLASADKDRERLDILSKNPSDLSWDDEKNLWHFSWSAGKGYGYSFLHRDIRVVIDAIASSGAALQPSPSLDHGAKGGTEVKP